MRHLVPGHRPARLHLTAPRTTFFEEQARHRRRTLRFAFFGFLAVALSGIPVSVIVTPVLFLVVLTAAHLINFATPIPKGFWDAIAEAGRLLPAALDPIDRGLNQGDWSQLDWLALGRLGLVLVAPGMAFMVLLWIWVRALFWHAGAGGVLLSIGARDPRPHDLEERQLANILHEMAIAAGIKPPAVKILDHKEPNAAVVGSAPDDATIVVTRGLLDTLDRNETQGVFGHLIGSVCNGDLRIAMLLLSVTQTFGLLTAILAAGSARSARRALWGAVRGLFIRDDRATQQVADLLSRDQQIEDPDQRQGCFSFVKLPFQLAAAATNFLIFIGQSLFFGPILGAMWRARRYLADATAVKLTRNPDGLAHALQRLQREDSFFAEADSTGLLFLHWRNTSAAPAGGWHPGLARRMARLVAQGARLRREGGAVAGVPRRRNPLVQLLGAVLTLIVVALSVVGIAAMLAGGVMIMTVTLMFVGAALFAIHGFFTVLPDLIHWLRFDAVPLARQIVTALKSLANQAR
ncbi:MAG: M48 family metalloprotease [Gemmatimonadales bacterium]|nr:M48 family metalloprotease [Gemmatimonadales bacterium]